MKNVSAKRLCAELFKATEFHRTNKEDPHGIGLAVATALNEVKTAIEIVRRTARPRQKKKSA